MDEGDVLEALFKATFDKMGRLFGLPLLRAKENLDAPRIAAAYRSKMRELHGYTRILGKHEPLLLDNIFTDVYIWEKPEATRNFTVEQLEAIYRAGDRRSNQVRYEGETVFEAKRRLFVLGKPGAGKTTFMRWIAIRAAKGNLRGIPIFITLKELADAEHSVWEHILYQLNLCGVPNPENFAKTLLNSGDAIVLFDGLDEVTVVAHQQAKVVADIRDFVRKYGKNHYLITCRTASLTTEFTEFSYVEVADFTPQQIETYVKRYFKDQPKKAAGCLLELRQERDHSLQQLASSPLLLSLFCLNYEQSGAFPAARIDLYEEALEALLKRWNGTRDLHPNSISPYGQMNPKRRGLLYTSLAYQNFLRNALFIKTKELVPQIEAFLEQIPGISETAVDGANVLRDMESQHGIIVERAQSIHAFAHLTFQEYYTAKFIADNDPSATLPELMKHSTDPRWREVFLLAASLLSDAGAFFELFLQHLEQLLLAMPPLLRLVKYVDQRREKYSSFSPIEGRRWNLFYSLELVRSRALNLARSRGRDLELDRALDLTIARALDRTLDRVLDRVLDGARALDHVLDRAHALDRALDRALNLNILDVYVRLDILGAILGQTLWVAESIAPFMQMAKDDAENLGLDSLTLTLTALPLPTEDDLDDDNPEWRSFRMHVRQLWTENWGTKWEWDDLLDMTVIQGINDYLYAMNLLEECLNLAVVTDREGIKNRLLLPPNTNST